MNLGTPIAKGNTAKVYLHENKIIKIYEDYLSEAESVKEAQKQNVARSCGLSVPEIFEVTKFNGKQAIIMEHIEGKTIGDLLLENMDKAEYYMSLSVDIQQKIHSKNSDSLELMTQKLSRQIHSAPLLSDRQKVCLLHKLDGITFEKKLCHGDFHLFNLMQSEDKIYIIDWVDASIGDIHADVYRTYLLYVEAMPELAKLYLRLYCEKSGMSEADVLSWAPIIAGARLSENVTKEKEERLLNIVNEFLLS